MQTELRELLQQLQPTLDTLIECIEDKLSSRLLWEEAHKGCGEALGYCSGNSMTDTKNLLKNVVFSLLPVVILLGHAPENMRAEDTQAQKAYETSMCLLIQIDRIEGSDRSIFRKYCGDVIKKIAHPLVDDMSHIFGRIKQWISDGYGETLNVVSKPARKAAEKLQEQRTQIDKAEALIQGFAKNDDADRALEKKQELVKKLVQSLSSFEPRTMGKIIGDLHKDPKQVGNAIITNLMNIAIAMQHAGDIFSKHISDSQKAREIREYFDYGDFIPSPHLRREMLTLSAKMSDVVRNLDEENGVRIAWNAGARDLERAAANPTSSAKTMQALVQTALVALSTKETTLPGEQADSFLATVRKIQDQLDAMVKRQT